jgi:hypothetical protein
MKLKSMQYLLSITLHVMIQTTVSLNNNYVLERIDENNRNKSIRIIRTLKEIAPLLNDLDLLQLYNKSISLHQSRNQKNGSFLENDIINKTLSEHRLSYRQQVTIDKSGVIIGFGNKIKCHHIIDFVVGDNIEIGKSITEYNVISCKTTCRERWTQDEWSFLIAPKLYILVTTSDDYPQSERFRESSKRKIITCTPKRKDDRIFKLNFENLIDELSLQDTEVLPKA